MAEPLPPQESNQDATTRTYQERARSNAFNRWINNRLDALTLREADKYVQRYATQPNGSTDNELAERIRFEVIRRGQMGREIDVFEPLRATAIIGGSGVIAGLVAKLIDDPKIVSNQKVLKTLKGGALATLATSLVQTGRILSFARFKAGLYAGAQTAIEIHHLQKEGQISPHLALSQTPTLSSTFDRNKAPPNHIGEEEKPPGTAPPASSWQVRSKPTHETAPAERTR